MAMKITIEFLDSDMLKLVKPIEVNAVYSKGSNFWTVSWGELPVYGVGRTVEEAIRNFSKVLEETYMFLKINQDMLSNYLCRILFEIKEIVREC